MPTANETRHGRGHARGKEVKRATWGVERSSSNKHSVSVPLSGGVRPSPGGVVRAANQVRRGSLPHVFRSRVNASSGIPSINYTLTFPLPPSLLSLPPRCWGTAFHLRLLHLSPWLVRYIRLQPRCSPVNISENTRACVIRRRNSRGIDYFRRRWFIRAWQCQPFVSKLLEPCWYPGIFSSLLFVTRNITRTFWTAWKFCNFGDRWNLGDLQFLLLSDRVIDLDIWKIHLFIMQA